MYSPAFSLGDPWSQGVHPVSPPGSCVYFVFWRLWVNDAHILQTFVGLGIRTLLRFCRRKYTNGAVRMLIPVPCVGEEHVRNIIKVGYVSRVHKDIALHLLRRKHISLHIAVVRRVTSVRVDPRNVSDVSPQHRKQRFPL